MNNFWLVIGINSRTMKREVIAESAMRDTAMCHKIDLERESPRRYCGVTIEYGSRKEWEQEESNFWNSTPANKTVH